MPLMGTSRPVSNIVSNPPRLPYPLYLGRLNWSASVDQAPTVSIEYQGLTLDQVGDLYGAWGVPLGSEIVNSYTFVNGAYLRVNSIAYSKQKLVYKGEDRIDIYSVSIELGNPHIDQNKSPQYDDVTDQAQRDGFVDWTGKDGPRLIKMGEGRSWSFPDERIIQDGSNSKSMDLVAYRDTELVLNYPPFGSEGSQYLKEPVMTQTTEGSDDPTRPPVGTRRFRDLTNVFDQGGDRKDWKISKRIDNQIYEEEIYSYGFLYYGEDGFNSLAIKSFVINNPQDYWRQIGYRKIQYLYQPIESLSLEIEIILPGNLQRIGFLVDPDYEQFAQKSGNILRMKTRARYLMIQEENGWEYHRFVKEEQPGMGAQMESRSTIISEEEKGVGPDGIPLSYYHDLKFQPLPIRSRTVYTLEPTRKYYIREQGEDIVGKPFSIEYIPYTDLPLYLKEKLGNAEELEEAGVLTPDLRVPIVKPDPNYVEPLFIAREERREHGFKCKRDWIAEQTEGPDPVTGDNTIWLTMGALVHRDVKRKPVLGNRVKVNGTIQFNVASGDGLFEFGYSEYVSDFRAEGPKFREAKQKLSFAEHNSMPPEAQYLLTQWVDKKQDPEYFQKQAERKRWYVTTSNSEFVKPGGTLNLEARNIQEAEKILRMQLRRDAADKIQAQKTVAWWIPGIKPGDTVMTDDLHGNRWVVYGVSWSIDYKGTNNATGRLFATCGGTQLTLGQDLDREYDLYSASGNYTPTIEPQVRVRLASDVVPIGEPLPIEQSRRNYG